MIFAEYHGHILEKLFVLVGFVIAIEGAMLNYWADHILISIRKGVAKKEQEHNYQIPMGIPFQLISCPNYLGEITMWTGFALAFRTVSLVITLVAVCANLIPRALQTHKWYLEQFGDKYPRNRRHALIPFVI